MYGLLLAILILDGLFLSIVVLLQSGKGGGLAAMGGGVSATEGVMGGRQATTVLTRATWISGTAFMVLSLVLSIMSSRGQEASSVIRPDAAPTQPAPVLPGLQDGGEGAPAEGGEGVGQPIDVTGGPGGGEGN